MESQIHGTDKITKAIWIFCGENNISGCNNHA